MIDHKRKVIFIHINKCAGTSIDTFFKGSHQKHACIRDYEDQLGVSGLDEYYKFTVVRNPWDKTVSYYHHIQRAILNAQHNVVNKYGSVIIDFEEFVKTKLDVNLAGGTKYAGEWLAKDQLNWLTDSTGRMCVDHICRFENLLEDFNTVREHVGMQNKDLSHANKTNHDHYTTYYNRETINIIAERHKRDIEYFGYKYGE